MEKTSVVIITYNRPLNILLRAVKSVLNQDYSNIELFVVNDFPENKVLAQEIQNKIIEINDDRVTYLTYDKNHGSNYARNFGLKHSTGTYIGFLDDDDEWYSNKISLQVAELDSNPNIGLVSCAFDIIRKGEIVKQKATYKNYDKSIEGILRFNYIGGSSFPLLRKKLVDELGGFDEKMIACQEYELWIRMRERSDFKTIEKSLGAYYDSADSTYKRKPDKYYLGDKRILEKHEKLFKQNVAAYNSHLNGMALQWLVHKRFKWYFNYKIRAIKVRPFSLDNMTIIKKLLEKLKRNKK